jgi:hypothetical protein
MSRATSHQALLRLLGIVTGILGAVMLLLLTRLVFEFFGELHRSVFYLRLHSVSGRLVVPLGLPSFDTPYRGVFDTATAATLVLLLFVEYLLGDLRRHV